MTTLTRDDPALSDHSHFCPSHAENYACDRPDCTLPAEARCPACEAA